MNYNVDIVIIRILGNDLNGIHGNEQTYNNLKFTLENEYPFENTNKIYILNRIYDKKKKRKIIELLEKLKIQYYDIKFELDEFLNIYKDYKNLYNLVSIKVNNANQKYFIQKMVKYNFYLINNNGARNYALKLGKSLKYKWIFIIDSNNYFIKNDFDNIVTNLSNNVEYIVIPQKRLKDNNYSNNMLLNNKNCNFINNLPDQEPQLGFKLSSSLYFDNNRPYGLSPKAEMLYLLGYKGPWENWIKVAKKQFNLGYREKPKIKYNYIKSGKIIRLDSMCDKNSLKNNSLNRVIGLKNLIKKILIDNKL